MRHLFRKLLWILFSLVILLLIGISLYQKRHPKAYSLQGETMGTTYHITLPGRLPAKLDRIEQEIDQRLQEIDQTFSTWIPDSELSRINRAPAEAPIPISAEFHRLLLAATDLSRRTGGAFDVTVGAIVNLWGFGPTESAERPTEEEIREALSRIGYHNLEIGPLSLKKRAPNIYLDFSAIAKGFGVDEVAHLLERYGVANYSIEIGGEVRVQGVNAKGLPWVIGIEKPEEGLTRGAALIGAIDLTEGAVATSGSYRIFKQYRGETFPHIIDPRTGRPVQSNLVSVTVLAPTCTEADGIATALMVMGIEEGLPWAEAEADVEALFLVQDRATQELQQYTTRGFNGVSHRVPYTLP